MDKSRCHDQVPLYEIDRAVGIGADFVIDFSIVADVSCYKSVKEEGNEDYEYVDVIDDNGLKEDRFMEV